MVLGQHLHESIQVKKHDNVAMHEMEHVGWVKVWQGFKD